MEIRTLLFSTSLLFWPSRLNGLSIPGAKVLTFGYENEPIVVIDEFSGAVELLIKAGLEAEYTEASAYYPGLRAPANPNYLRVRDKMMLEIFNSVFGLRRNIICENASYSLVTTPRSDLTSRQRIPHVDDIIPNVLAIMHYLGPPETGGTAFYRHRRTGYETLTKDRYAAYQTALKLDDEEFGQPAKGYICGDTDRYEMIGKVDAKPDRLILYRGQILHSGWIPHTLPLSSDPAKGRLTINMFLKGNP